MKNTLLQGMLLLFVSFIIICFSGCSDDKESNPTNTNPVARFVVNRDSGYVMTQFVFDASSCTDAEDATSDLQVRWDWNNDGHWDSAFSTNKIEAHVFQHDSTYTVRMEVKDSGNLTATKTINLSVVANNSVPFASLSVNPIFGTTSTQFTFDASGSTDSHDTTDLLQVRWDWNNDGIWDEDYSTDKIKTHVFSTPGQYYVVMQVKNSSNNTTEKKHYLYITEALQEMTMVPGGSFLMGSTTGQIDEQPIHTVFLSPFYMSRHEITSAEYYTYMPHKHNKSREESIPAYGVNWFNAIKYCNLRSLAEGLTPAYTYLNNGTNPNNWPNGWDSEAAHHTNISCDWTANGYRLPTEAEWEYAAKGSDSENYYLYSGSNLLNDVAWYGYNHIDVPKAIGQKAPNQLGIYDMSGNVWEWVWDNYPTVYTSATQTNPHGATSGNYRCIRGGAADSQSFCCTVTYRLYCDPYTGKNLTGLRICRNAY